MHSGMKKGYCVIKKKNPRRMFRDIREGTGGGKCPVVMCDPIIIFQI